MKNTITVQLTNGFSLYPEVAGEPDIYSEVEYYNEQRKEAGLEPLTETQIEKMDEIYFSPDMKEYAKGVENHVNRFIGCYYTNIHKAFLKHGLDIKDSKLYSPKQYNFETDSIDLVIEVGNVDLERLKPAIEKYQAEIKRKTCDGYISFEPNTFKDVSVDDNGSWGAIVWAILETEGLHEDVKSLVTELYEYSNDFYTEAIDWDAINKITGV